MKLRVLFFASLKEHLGTSEVQLDLDSLPPIEALMPSSLCVVKRYLPASKKIERDQRAEKRSTAIVKGAGEP